MAEDFVNVLDRLSGQVTMRPKRWYDQIAKNNLDPKKNKNILKSDGSPRWVLADGQEYVPPVQTEAQTGKKKVEVVRRESAGNTKRVLTETHELTDETIVAFLKGSGQVESVERLRNYLGEERAAIWKDRLDARITDINAANETKKEEEPATDRLKMEEVIEEKKIVSAPPEPFKEKVQKPKTNKK